MIPWWLRVKRFGFAPTFQDHTRWKRQGNVYTLRKPDREQDKWFDRAEFKATNKLNPEERLKIAGVANANIVDRVQERVDPRGLDATDFLRNPQLLAHHSYYCPVGQVEVLDPQDDGVKFDGWVGDPAAVGGPQNLTDMQKEMRSLVAQRVLKTVSIGFIPHKFQAPIYDDRGNLVEPLVILSWELLELSIVAIPCNQLSIFEIRSDDSASGAKRFFPGVDIPGLTSAQRGMVEEAIKGAVTSALKESGLRLNAKDQNLERETVQALLFAKDTFTKEEAIAWCKEREYRTDVSEDGESYVFEQRAADDFEPESFRTLMLEEGVTVKAGTPKNKAAGGTTPTPPANAKEGGEGEGGAEDDDEGNYRKESITLLRTIGQGLQRSIGLQEEMMKVLLKTDAPAAEGEGEEEEGEKPEEEDEEKSQVEERFAKLEGTLTKLASVVETIAKRIA